MAPGSTRRPVWSCTSAASGNGPRSWTLATRPPAMPTAPPRRTPVGSTTSPTIKVSSRIVTSPVVALRQLSGRRDRQGDDLLLPALDPEVRGDDAEGGVEPAVGLEDGGPDGPHAGVDLAEAGRVPPFPDERELVLESLALLRGELVGRAYVPREPLLVQPGEHGLGGGPAQHRLGDPPGERVPERQAALDRVDADGLPVLRHQEGDGLAGLLRHPLHHGPIGAALEGAGEGALQLNAARPGSERLVRQRPHQPV